MDEKQHWDQVYGRKATDAVSWYRPHLERSLALIEGAALDQTEGSIDVGGGASTLVDDLLDRDYQDITVLDLSSVAIDGAKARLGARADFVTWLVGDVTRIPLPEKRFAFWHDRAVFHFLTTAEDRRAYVAAVRRALKVNGHIEVNPPDGHNCSRAEVVKEPRLASWAGASRAG